MAIKVKITAEVEQYLQSLKKLGQKTKQVFSSVGQDIKNVFGNIRREILGTGVSIQKLTRMLVFGGTMGILNKGAESMKKLFDGWAARVKAKKVDARPTRHRAFYRRLACAPAPPPKNLFVCSVYFVVKNKKSPAAESAAGGLRGRQLISSFISHHSSFYQRGASRRRRGGSRR